MDISAFRKLAFLEKFLILWDEGKYLARFEGHTQLANLFQIQDFFVEVYYNKKNDDILYIHPFEEEEQLDKYLDQIDISVLRLSA